MAANSNCQWWSGCAEPIWSGSGRIPLCERHCLEFKKTDHEREMDVLKEIRDDLKTLLPRQG
jgi:hypothetical protein